MEERLFQERSWESHAGFSDIITQVSENEDSRFADLALICFKTGQQQNIIAKFAGKNGVFPIPIPYLISDMKKLIYIPIVHNKADLGSLGSQLSVEGEKRYGASLWQQHVEQVDKSWDNIESEILKQLKKKPFDKVRIYQDGLPVVDEIGIKIVKETAENGSKNYSIIDRLLSKGAKLELAENKEFLIREYYLLSDLSKAGTPENQLESYLKYQQVSQELLASRDHFIANRINMTLKDGETGIAFFGAAHAIIDKLNKEIKVVIIQMFKDEISLNLMKIK